MATSVAPGKARRGLLRHVSGACWRAPRREAYGFEMGLPAGAERLLATVRAYFDAAGPLIGRPWPITYREDEQSRVATLRAFGVAGFTALLYPHKPGMARSLNEWGADFAARTPGCLHSGAARVADDGDAGSVRAN
jgi:hypothetical protein